MKAANSYGSLLRGVSQQVAQDRSDGQHTEQVNMLSDPVNGLSRRHGSLWQAEKHMTSLLPAQLAAYVTDTAAWTSRDFDVGGKEYIVALRQGARPVGPNPLPVAIVYNKTDKVFLDLVRNVTDTQLDLVESGGVAAATAIGKYLFVSGNTTVASGASNVVWNTNANFEKAVVWVRGGAFSRKYTVTVRRQTGVQVSVNYTTPSSSYQGVLTTADIPSGAADYTKQVNDRVNAYNGLVTQWIGTSTAAVQPAAIATQLRDLLVAAGVTCTVQGSHICFSSAVPIQSVEVDDGGDGSLIRGVADEVESVDKVSVIHFVGKVVKVRSRNAAEAFYLKAVAKDKAVTTGYTEVTWVEGAGVEHSISGGLTYCTVSGNNFYMASSATLLNTILPGTHPTYSVSTAGDDDSAPAPFFVGRKITYLGAFQNRLLVGSGGVLAVSKTEDFLNFFRSTVLTLPANDPFEMLPQGSEDDELFHGTLYDQDLVIFGKKRQYVISGNNALTPTAANMAVMSSYEGVADAAPVSAGGYIFYAKRGEMYSSLHQIQPGQTENSPESFPASSQIDTYLQGGAIEMASATGSPSTLFMRTTGYRYGVYSFSYLDKQDGRKMDAWSRWKFHESLGPVIGWSVVTEGLLILSIRVDGTKVYTVADLCSLTTGLSSQPYLDSLRPWASVASGTGSVTTASGASWAAAFNATSTRRFTGTLLPDVAGLQASFPGEPGLMVGAVQDAYFIPTNPFMRDGKDKAVLSGRLVVTKKIIAFRESVGFDWSLSYRDAVVTEVSFNGRIMGDPTNVIGIEPVATGQHNIPVGRETRQYDLTIKARKWYPFTVTAIEWVGQFFTRVQRY